MVDDELSCAEREIWNKLYTDFALTRKVSVQPRVFEMRDVLTTDTEGL
jgi:hypothetical protein